MARCIPFSVAKSLATTESESPHKTLAPSSVGVQGLAGQGSAQPVEPPKHHIIRIKFVRNKGGESIKPSDEPPKVAEAGVNSMCFDEKAIEEKLEATKRKLHKRYEQLETFKKQKRIQVLSYVPSQHFKIPKPQKSANKPCFMKRKGVAKKAGGLQRLLAC